MTARKEHQAAAAWRAAPACAEILARARFRAPAHRRGDFNPFFFDK
jgi:hypothetical protein